MKHLPTVLVALLLLPAGVFAQSYTAFRVCEERRVLRTTDGAEAGNIEFLIIEPAKQRIVMTVITGGTIGEKHVGVPFSALSMSAENEITLANINRERLLAAPAVEISRLMTTSGIEPKTLQPTFAHFGVDLNAATPEAPVAVDPSKSGTGQ